MAKFLFVLVALSVCQYGAASQEEIAAASALIEQYAPSFVTDIVKTVGAVTEQLPSADEAANIVQTFADNFDKIKEQAGQIQIVAADAGHLFGTILHQAVANGIAAASHTVQQQLTSKPAIELVAAASGCISEVAAAAGNISEAVDEVLDISAHVVEAI